MIQAISKRLNREEKGFTLIELMVVVLIIAILIAIAVPTFLGARKRAQARAAQSNVRNAYSAAKVYFSDNERYAPIAAATTDATDLIAKLAELEPSLVYSAAGVSTTDPKQVFVRVNNTNATPTVVNGIVCLSVQGADGNIYTLRDNSSGATAGVMYHKSTDGTTPTCAADNTAYTANGWTS